MDYLSLAFIIVSVNFVYCEDLLPVPCDDTDTACLNNATETFLAKTAAGIPEFNIFPIDPLVIPLVDVGKDKEVDVYLKNIVITGLRNQKISNFKLDKKTKSVVLSTSANITINADMVMAVDKKQYTGNFSATASPLGTAKYSYSFFKDAQGVEHFLVGPEVTTCENEGEPIITFGADLEKAMNTEPKVKELREKDDTLRGKMICKVVEVAYITVVHNIRASAKLVPKSAFFTNV